MRKRKICGFDLNGWRDFAAKNWHMVPGEEDEVGSMDIVEAGPMTSVVYVGDGPAARWIGGPQADIAPHGWGGGWGMVGNVERRVSVRALLEGGDERVSPFVAAIDGLAQGAAFNVVSIEDSADSTEVEQERVLAALAAGKFRNSMLVWRPVLAALQALEMGLISGGQRVAVICQSKSGVSIQKLVMRRASGKDNEVIAPERSQAGITVEGDVGYEKLIVAARKMALGEDGMTARTAHRARARTAGKAGMGLPCPPEMLRRPNGDWDLLDLGLTRCLATSFLSEPLPDISDCAVVLVESLSEGLVKDGLLEYIKRSATCPVIGLPTTAVVEGALVAARRMRDGNPVYFDFLPRISTIVFGSDGVRNFDLINADETLEAGRVYRSPTPAKLAIPPGQQSISVYLRKEAEPNPRKATIHLDKPLKEQSPVSLWVEQKPAAGRAKIIMEARSLGRQFAIDWDEAEVDNRSWEAIIESHEAEVSIPARLVLPCGIRLWEENPRSVGLFEALQTQLRRDNPDWDALSTNLSSRALGEYCISSDGELPAGIDQESIGQLGELTQRALQLTRDRLSKAKGSEDVNNAALKFLTWQFRRCPKEVVGWLTNCIQSRTLPIFEHPFVRRNNWVLVYQGLGRIVNGDADEKHAVRLLLASRVEDWNWRVESACMAFLLSRSDAAPKLLERKDVERLARRTIKDFERNIRTEYTTFNYAPFLMAGLLRWRLKETTALLLGVDPLADKFLEVLERVERDLSSRHLASDQFIKKREKYLPLLADLKDELKGEGSNPDLLLDIYNAT